MEILTLRGLPSATAAGPLSVANLGEGGSTPKLGVKNVLAPLRIRRQVRVNGWEQPRKCAHKDKDKSDGLDADDDSCAVIARPGRRGHHAPTLIADAANCAFRALARGHGQSSGAQSQPARRKRRNNQRLSEEAINMAVTMFPVQSSAIKSVGHDASTNTVHVEFHTGGTHRFGPFAKPEFDRFLSAGSIGKHFHAHIRAKAIK